MTTELRDRRVLGAVRFVDHSARHVDRDLQVVSDDGRWLPNRSGTWVLHATPALRDHLDAFLGPPAEPPLRSVTVRSVVSDRRGRFLPRAFSLAVPRPARAGDGGLFDPVDVVLPPAPAATLQSSWGRVRVHVRFEPTADQPEGVPIEGAVVRLNSPTLRVATFSRTDARGEALVVSPRIPRFSPGEAEDEVLVPQVPHWVGVYVDLAATDPSTGRRATAPDLEDVFDRRNGPDVVRVATQHDLGAGQELALRVVLPRARTP